MDGGRPGDVEGRACRDARGRGDADLGRCDLHRRRRHRALALVQHVAHLVETRLRRRDEGFLRHLAHPLVHCVGALLRTGRHDGHVVLRVDGGRPGDVEGRACRDLCGRGNLDLRLRYLYGDGGHRALCLVAHVAHLVETRLRRRDKGFLGLLAHPLVHRVGALLRTGRHDGHIVLRMNGGRPGDGQDRPRRDLRGGRESDVNLRLGLGLGFRLRFGGFQRLQLHDALDMRQGILELCGIARRNEHTASVLGDAGKAGVFLLGEVEPDDMGGELHPLARQFGRERARIRLAGFQSVGNQHDGCRGVAVGEQLGRLPDGFGQRRAPARHDPVDRRNESGPVQRPRSDHGLDIRTVPLAAVSVGHEADIGILRPCPHEIAHDVARDLDLGDAVDLAPHRAGGVIDDDDVFLRDRRCAKRRRCADCGDRQHGGVEDFHGLSLPNVLPVRPDADRPRRLPDHGPRPMHVP